MSTRWLAPVLFFTPAIALAQSAGGFSIDPSKEGANYQTTVTEASPAFTQDRVAAGSRFWLLDPGRYEVELWWNDKFQKDIANFGRQEGMLQAEIEIGLAPHLQLDLYQNFALSDDGGHPGWYGTEGVQIELRIAFARTYNAIPLNPVLYLEWHPHRGGADRFEARLLLGGDVTPRLLGILNLYAEANVDTVGAAPAVLGAAPPLNWANTDMEVGVTGALTYGIDVDHFRLGIEGQLGLDQHGNFDPTDPQHFYLVAMLGPNVLIKWPEYGLKLTGTCFFGLAPEDARVYPLVILGKQW